MTTEETNAPRFSVSTSATIGAIAKALAVSQAAMGPAIKDRVGRIPGKDGKQGYEYGYATLAACFEAIQPMHANGIAVSQIPLDGGNGVLVATLLMHESGEWIRGEMWMPVAQQSPQGYGSALTYARRYGLSALCGLASDDDDGAAATHGPGKAPPAQRPGPVAVKPAAAPTQAKAQGEGELFALFCDKVDRAEAVAQLNLIASDAMKAFKAGGISEVQVERLKLALTKKKGLLAAPAREPGDDREEDVAS